MTTALGSQKERIRARLHKHGYVTRNECLSQFPAITRLSARIADLELEKYVFRTEDTGRDYIYKLVSIKGEPYINPADLAHAARLVREFDQAGT